MIDAISRYYSTHQQNASLWAGQTRWSRDCLQTSPESPTSPQNQLSRKLELGAPGRSFPFAVDHLADQMVAHLAQIEQCVLVHDVRPAKVARMVVGGVEATHRPRGVETLVDGKEAVQLAGRC